MRRKEGGAVGGGGRGQGEEGRIRWEDWSLPTALDSSLGRRFTADKLAGKRIHNTKNTHSSICKPNPGL